MSKSICLEFIKEFLPPVDSKRKYDSNTAISIVISMNYIFKKYMGEELPKDMILDCFEELDYNFMFTRFEYDHEKKKAYIRPNGNTIIREGYGRDSEEKHYINISPPDLNILRKASKKMPLNTNPEKVDEYNKIRLKLEKFFSTYK